MLCSVAFSLHSVPSHVLVKAGITALVGVAQICSNIFAYLNTDQVVYCLVPFAYGQFLTLTNMESRNDFTVFLILTSKYLLFYNKS